MEVSYQNGNGVRAAESEKKNFFKRFAERISFRGLPSKNQLPKPADSESVIQFEKLNELRKNMEENNPLLSRELQQQISRSMVFFWKNGKYDGSIRQQEMGSKLFETHAQQIKEGVAASLQSQLAKYKVMHAIKEKVHQAKQALSRDAERYRTEVDIRRELYPRSFSRFLAAFYIVLAIALILADIPLALKLTQYGFNLFTAKGAHAIDNLFLTCAGENVIEHIWMVFASNWEVFVLAFGVALCTVYVKIFYDDLMGYPVDKAVRQYKIMKRYAYALLPVNNDLNPVDQVAALPASSDASDKKPRNKEAESDFSKKEMKRIKFKAGIRTAVKFLLLLVTLITIFQLGIFRSENQKQINKTSQLQDISKAKIKMKLEIHGLPSDSISTEEAYQAEVLKAQRQEKYNKLTKWCFILITLLFPVIGGICLSLGFGNIHNLREFAFAKKYYERKHADEVQALEERLKVEQNQDICQRNLERCEAGDFVSNYSIFFKSCYEHGYERGKVEPDRQAIKRMQWLLLNPSKPSEKLHEAS